MQRTRDIVEKPIENMSKDELDIYARDNFGVELDKRRRIDDLIEHVKVLIANKGKPVEQEKKTERHPKKVRHIKTGVEWFWSPLYKGNPDLEVIEWE
jgi:hypothetical protein